MNAEINQCEGFGEKSKLLYTPCDIQEHENFPDSPNEEARLSGIVRAQFVVV